MATLLVCVLAGVFIVLGLWQLDRLEQRRTLNAIGEARLAAEPVALAELSTDLVSSEYRRVVVSGVFDTTEEVLIRSQVELGQAGFHVITPLVTSDGQAVLVNRGWVPLAMDDPPVPIEPQQGQVEIEGWVHLTQPRPPFGPVDGAGRLEVLNRVDIERLSQQSSHELAAVYVVALGEGGTELPIAVDPPDFGDEGPHLAYALQWFGFAAVGLVGFFLLLRRQASRDQSASLASSSTTSKPSTSAS